MVDTNKGPQAKLIISVIIPARNEEAALASMLPDIPAWVDHVIVADNGSSDNTANVAQAHGALVRAVPIAGYGRACLAGIDVAKALGSHIIVFLDGDRSDYPAQMKRLVEPILLGKKDMVIGSRIRGKCLPGALTPQQYFGNSLACSLIKLFWGYDYTDLGPFRAIATEALDALDMHSPTFGWTVEMQIKALQRNLSVAEVPVDYRKRIGVSKISGTVRGVILAGYYILSTIFRAAIADALRFRKTEYKRKKLGRAALNKYALLKQDGR
jgi:glycosyltransferase involved in cell wall biosynthesis